MKKTIISCTRAILLAMLFINCNSSIKKESPKIGTSKNEELIQTSSETQNFEGRWSFQKRIYDGKTYLPQEARITKNDFPEIVITKDNNGKYFIKELRNDGYQSVYYNIRKEGDKLQFTSKYNVEGVDDIINGDYFTLENGVLIHKQIDSKGNDGDYYNLKPSQNQSTNHSQYTATGTIKDLEFQGNNYLKITLHADNGATIYIWCTGGTTTVYSNNQKKFWTDLNKGMKIGINGTNGEIDGKPLLDAQKIYIL